MYTCTHSQIPGRILLNYSVIFLAGSYFFRFQNKHD